MIYKNLSRTIFDIYGNYNIINSIFLNLFTNLFNGGAIYSINKDSKLKCYNTIFKNCSSIEGGSIYLEIYSFNFDILTISYSTAKNGQFCKIKTFETSIISNSIITYSSFKTEFKTKTLDLRNSKTNLNYINSTNNNVHVSSFIEISISKINFCKILNNFASLDSNSIFFDSSEIKNCNFINNSDGSIINSYNYLQIMNSIFLQNKNILFKTFYNNIYFINCIIDLLTTFGSIPIFKTSIISFTENINKNKFEIEIEENFNDNNNIFNDNQNLLDIESSDTSSSSSSLTDNNQQGNSQSYSSSNLIDNSTGSIIGASISFITIITISILFLFKFVKSAQNFLINQNNNIEQIENILPNQVFEQTNNDIDEIPVPMVIKKSQDNNII